MKSSRTFFRIGVLAISGCMIASCVDESYDLTKADYEMLLMKDGIHIPIGSLELTMDSILKVDENSSSGLRVKNNMYYFSLSSQVNVGNLNQTISNLTLDKPGDFSTSIGLNFQGVGQGQSLPSGTNESFSQNIENQIPDFNTQFITVKKVDLKSTTFTMRNTTSGLSGNNLNQSIRIRCTPLNNVGTYLLNGQPLTNGYWEMNGNDEVTIELSKLDLTTEQTLKIQCQATIQVASYGDVTLTSSTPSINVSAQFNGIDFTTAYGKIDYSMSETNLQEFEGFGDLLGGGNNVLSIHNPQIKFKWRENLGVPVYVNMDITAKNEATNDSVSLTNTQFTLAAAENSSAVVVDSAIIDYNNGTSNLLKINPTMLRSKFSIRTDNTLENSFISKDLQINLESEFEIPVQFNDDLLLNVSDTIDNPFGDVVEKLGTQRDLAFGLNFDVENRIPLNVVLKLTALDDMGSSMFTEVSDTILAAGGIDANGFATQATESQAQLSISSANIDRLKDVAQFKIEFIVIGEETSNGFVTISPSDYIHIQVGALVTGGMVLDLNKEEDE
jgi:hypothetical protein